MPEDAVLNNLIDFIRKPSFEHAYIFNVNIPML